MAISLDDVEALDDPVMNNRWELRFTNIPGIRLFDKQLTLKCNSCTVPSRRQGEIVVEAFGTSVKFPGRKQSNEALQTTFLENGDMSTLRLLEEWSTRVSDPKSGNSSGKKTGGFGSGTYATTALLIPIGVDNNELRPWFLGNVWPSFVGGSGFDSAGSDVFIVNAEFTYDYYLHGEAEALGGVVSNLIPQASQLFSGLSNIQSQLSGAAVRTLTQGVSQAFGSVGSSISSAVRTISSNSFRFP
jgi:hypothetical protein